MTQHTIARFLVCSAAVLAMSASAADEPVDTEISLGEVGLPVWMPAYGDGFAAPVAAYPISAAQAPVPPDKEVTGTSVTDVTETWTLSAWTVGRTFSEQTPSARIGDYCGEFPFEADEIDWKKTIAANANNVDQGLVVFNKGASSPYERLLFTASGATTVLWVNVDGTQVSGTYTIGATSAARPYRIFATRVDEANSAALIDLTGKFVRFFGDRNLLSSEWKATSTPGVSNVVYGLDYDPSQTKMLTFRYVVDEKTETIRCPQGQFVLAYYDTETKDHMVAHIVVEVCPPTVNTLYAEVGDALRPAGGGYSGAGLHAAVVAGLSQETSDPYSPYLHKYTAEDGEEVTDPDHGKVFAIAPTDVSTSSSGIAMPWKADIYWKTADPMKTQWTFEHDWYLVTWPKDPLRVVVAPSDAAPGCPFLVPTNYIVSTLFRMPEDVSAECNSSTGEVELRGGDGGKILVQLSNRNDSGCPSYIPVELTDFRSLTVATQRTFDWPVGIEITPQTGFEAGPDARAMSERVDDGLPGYIYEPESTGRNWNPRLYHSPRGSSGMPDVSALTEGLGAEGEASTDPYASLKSAIYGVNQDAGNGKIQVWWRASFKNERMQEAVTYPALVQNYRVSWETTMAEGFLPEIALSSGFGSADSNMTACSGRSLLLSEASSSASLNLGGAQLDAKGGMARVGFALFLGSDRPVTSGHLARLGFGEHGATNAGRIDARLVERAGGGWQVEFSANDAVVETVSVETGRWNAVSAEVPQSIRAQKVTVSMATYGSTGSDDSATGVALDDLALWCGTAAIPASERDAVFAFRFGDGDLSAIRTNGTVRTATDVFGNALRSLNCAVLGMGVSKAFSLRLVTAGGVVPEIYYQNVQGEIGFNPNEEHAFVSANGDEYVVWALRNDLNGGGLSKPVVLVMYSKDGKGAMQAYRVVTQNAAYPRFEKSVVAGNAMLPPGPIGRVPGWGTDNDVAITPMDADDSAVVYKDRKNQMWARRDGIALALYSYPMQPGFYCPSLGANQLADGTVVGWMNCVGVGSPSESMLKDGYKSLPWTWKSTWPDKSSVPTMRVGQVLTVAENGLPEVWSAASMAIAYPSPSDEAGRTVVQLIDPTVKQCASLEITADFASEYGFTLGSSGTTSLRKGKYYFTGLPPSISDRFYVDANADEDERMCLVGKRVVKESGGSYLQLNVLTDDERAALKGICTLDTAASKWCTAVDALATNEVVASVRDGEETGLKPYEINKTYAFPSQGAFSKWLGMLSTTNFPVTKVVADDQTEYAVVTGPMPEGEHAKFMYATCSYTVVSNVWKTMPPTIDLAAAWTANGLREYTGLDWAAENATTNGYLVARVNFTTTVNSRVPTTDYKPRDHYALVATGAGDGWVTLVENDNKDQAQVNPGLPVSMKLLRVLPELHVDGIAVLSDPLNKLSEKLTLQYRTPLGSATSDYEFQWRRATPAADGTLSTTSYESPPWEFFKSGNGLYSVLLGANGARPDEYVNTYYTLRYRAKEGTLAASTVGTGWSAWAPEQLAEGWLQRVLNSVTPFAQRVEDFYEKKADSWLSMLEEIGRPYQGDVALNNDNLTQIGLLELYQTLFNRAESVLQAYGASNVNMSKQLMLAQTRMGEFYSLLGSEAYSDAKNPLVTQQSLDVLEGSALTLPSSVFCFNNQVPSLLDEELALLRGRSASTAYPRMTEAPCYNRLAWNFTKDLVGGEPAYVANYGIRARTDGVIDVNCAAAQYPQGHGDAWGHYLSVLTGYYRLLRNPLFDWTAAMGEMLMDQKLVNVDYQDEEKFADAVAKMAQTGLDAMELTVRKQYRENGSAAGGYRDSDSEQAFGYGEWATRTGLAAAYGWMTANALLPTNDAPYAAFKDRGIMKIDRTTAPQLSVICDVVRSVQDRLAATEAGFNPLGLSDNAVPFDIDPDRLAEKDSHFEQILERAEVALANCRTALDYANVYGTRIAQISREEKSLIDEIAETELAYNNQLIAIYGTPFAGDIGPGGTYPQGYEGPDLYNYNYMDLGPYMLDNISTVFTNTWTLKWGNELGFSDLAIKKDSDGNLSLAGESLGVNVKKDEDITSMASIAQFLPDNLRRLLYGSDSTYEMPVSFSLDYTVSEGGIRIKPDTVTGVRATEGSIQSAYREYLIAYKELANAIYAIDMMVPVMQQTWKQLRYVLGKGIAMTLASGVVVDMAIAIPKGVHEDNIESAKMEYDFVFRRSQLEGEVVPAAAGAGTTVVTSPKAIAAVSNLPAETTSMVAEYIKVQSSIKAKEVADTVDLLSQLVLGIANIATGIYDLAMEVHNQMRDLALQYDGAVMEVGEKFGALSTAEAAYRAEVYRGQMLQDERAVWRRKLAGNATARRYLDMYNRVQRNAALAKYSTAFDTAQRYVWELAKVYDYETGLLSSDPQAGKQFLADIIATRALGQEGVSINSATTDGGLYDVVNRMKANWAVLKPRLGINNPDKPAKWFSLRRELFRIKEGADGDAAWKKELAKYRVENILTDPDFQRHCQPPASASAVVCREPGYIIPFSTAINNAENFFGNVLQFGDGQFSSSDYATKIDAVGVNLVGLNEIPGGENVEPNIYLVPVGLDYMRSPAGTDRALLSWNVIDQVLPLPYTVGSDELDATDWIATFSGLDGTSDSTATIRRHSTLRGGSDFKSTRLVGRSVWNDRWLIVIPASAIDADREKAMKLIEAGVKDIKLGIKAYSRQGN